MSLLLSRPLIINQSYYPFELPNLQLECHATDDGPPSLIAHIVAQCELGRIITKVPATMGGTLEATEAEALKADMDKWLASLPPVFRESDPDTRWDEEHNYVPLQRRLLHAIGYMTMLLPFKAFLTKSFSSESSETDRARRATAIDIALHLMEISRGLFEHVFPINAKFHVVTFLIFDTGAFLCSAIIHDKDRSLPQRDRVIQAIRLACSLMEKLATVTKTGAICYPVLTRLAKSLSMSSKSPAKSDGAISNSGGDHFGPSPDSDAFPLPDTISPEPLSSSLDSMAPEMFLPASLDLPVPGLETPPIMGVGDFSNLDAGQFDQIWDWQNLDLTLLPSLPT